MSECLHCQISFEYGKKFCKTCGRELIESKDILETIKINYEKDNFNDALDAIEKIPPFSFFYDAAIMYSMFINIKNDDIKKVTDISLNSKLSNLTKVEKSSLGKSLLEYAGKKFEEKKYLV